MKSSEERRDDRSWKLAASLLGFVALVAAGATVGLLDVEAPWDLVVYFGGMATVLLGGTMWLVPGSRAKQVQRTAGTTDALH